MNNMSLKYYSSDLGYKLAILLLFVKMPIQSVWIFQEYYWGYSEIPRQIFKIALETPIIITLIYLFLSDLFGGKLNKFQKLGFALSVVLVLIIFTVIYFHLDIEEFKELNYSNLKLIPYYGTFFLIGYFISKPNQVIPWIKYVLIGGLILMSLNIILFYNVDTFSIDYDNSIQKGYLHLFTGDSYAIWSILTIVFIRKKFRFIIYFLCLIFLFSLSSRGAFYCYLTFVILLMDWKNIRFQSVATAITFTLLIVIAFYLLKDHRMFSLLSGNDLSLNYRLSILKTSFPDILNNWFKGDYGGHLRYYPPLDKYIHNFLSFWRQFGLIPMIIIFFLIMMSFYNVKFHFHNNLASNNLIIVALFVYIILGIIFAKGYNYTQIFLLFGFIGSSQEDCNITSETIPKAKLF